MGKYTTLSIPSWERDGEERERVRWGRTREWKRERSEEITEVKINKE